MLEVCIVGLGALGVLYGFVIEKSGKARVTAVCRSNYEVVKSHGVDFKSEKYGVFKGWKPSRVVATTADAADRPYNFVISAAKFIPDLIPTSHVLGPLLSRTSTFLLIQNGIGVHEELLRAVPKATVISACAWANSTAIDGGKVVVHGHIDRIVLGIHWLPEQTEESSKSSQMQLVILAKILRVGGCDVLTEDHINSARWQKNIMNIGYSVFCTLSRAKVATVLNDKWVATTTPIVRGLMEEALSVARATGIPLADSAIAYAQDTAFTKYAETYPPRKITPFTPMQFKPSMLVDLEAGRPMEVEGIIGNVVKKGRSAGVSMPRLEMAYASLMLLQEPLLHRVGNSTSA